MSSIKKFIAGLPGSGNIKLAESSSSPHEQDEECRQEMFRSQLDVERSYLQTLMDSIPDAIYFKDLQHRFVKVSKYVHLQGISDLSDAIGKTDFDFFTDEHARQAYDDEEEIFRTGKPIVGKLEKETFPSGEIAWVSSTKVPLYDLEGRITGLVGISRDITEEKLKEQALETSEERYRNLIEYLPDTVAVFCEEQIVFINSAGIELLKAGSINDILNKSVDSIVHSQYKALVKRFSSLVNKNQKPFSLKLIKIRTFQNDFLDIEMTGIPTTFNDKPAIQVIIRDVTEIKKQEKINQTTLRILQASNYSRNTNELFHYIHNAIGRLMPVRNFYIALYDEESATISFPYFVDETEDFAEPAPLGKGLTEYILRTGKAQLIDEATDIELKKRGEIELIGEPSKVWLGVPLLIKDKTIGVMVVQDYHDANAYTEKDKETLELISFSVSRAIERKQAEDEKLVYIEKLKESNTTKDRFFSFISHDLRGPFSSLLGFSELILEDFDKLEKNDMRRFLEIINSTARNLYHLLNNLLQFSRFQVGRMNFEPEKLSIKALISGTINLLGGNAIKKDIQMVNEVKTARYVFADEEMLNSVIQNLITNAIKFTPRGGKITISESLGDTGFVQISVTDTGIGMTQSALNNLFSLEHISSTSGTEKEAGSGLGLLLTKEFIEKNGGSISVNSTPGQGSTFSFTVPLIDD
ncbi:MAG: PAS domain-containing sensor histidine kinase [Bacteroidota bacterium]